jgi:hypothetical protein
MNINNILFLPHNFCSDIKDIEDQKYIIIENLHKEETCSNYNFNGRDKRFIILCLIIFKFHCNINNVPNKNICNIKLY